MNYLKLIDKTYRDERLREKRITREETHLVVGVFVEAIFEALITEGKVSLKNLFTLNAKKSKGKNIVDVNTQRRLKTKDYYRITVTPSVRLKENLKEKVENEL